MHDDTHPDATDPGELTQRHEVGRVRPAAEPAPEPVQEAAVEKVPVLPVSPGSTGVSASPITPSAPVSPALGAAQGTPVDRYSPDPEPRASWARTWDEANPVTPERWYEPAPAAAAPTRPVAARTRTGGGSVLAVALLSAVLASGGTVLALGAAGVLDRPAAPASGAAQATNAGPWRPVPADDSAATIAVAAQVSPAVVLIEVRGASNSGQLGVIPPTGVGSGVIFDSNGWILTNHHVVAGGETFDVELSDGRVLPGEVYGIDTLTDLAIVKVNETGLPAAAIGGSDALQVGQLVIAIGSPLGTYSNSVTSGIVSAKGRSIVTDNNDTLTNLIQTDAAINPGNSGGPLLDAGGNVVGINTAIATNSNGIGFAIPIDVARPIMDQALAGEPLARPYMGIHFVSITRQLADAEQLPVNAGALVRRLDDAGQPIPAVEAGTPAAAAGIEDGDIVVSVNGKVIDQEHPLDATLSQFSPGDTITVEILRDGESLMLPVTLGTRPAQ